MSDAWQAETAAGDADTTRELAGRLAGILAGGDLIVLSGELGAGKTTFTQGLGAGLGVAGRVISPTFVIARRHRGTGGRPDLVHVDAYRLGSPEELDDLDLESGAEDAVTVVEWGRGLVDQLAESRLEIDIVRPTGTGEDGETRRIVVRGVGPRWAGARDDVARLLRG